MSIENENILQNIDEQELGEEAEAILSQVTGGGSARLMFATTIMGGFGGSAVGGILGNGKSVGSAGGAGIGAGVGVVAGAGLGSTVLATKNNWPAIQKAATELVRR